MGAKSDHFCLFSAYSGVFSPDLWMEYQIFISIVDISANLENVDIDKAILKNITIDKGNLQNIGIDNDKAILENMDINIDIDKEILENIDIDIDIFQICRYIDNRYKYSIFHPQIRGKNTKIG